MMMRDEKPLEPGACIGILGGGQLGRFLAMAAADLGFACHVYCPEDNAPAFAVAGAQSCAAYEDEAALADFARRVDVVTYEFENIPAASLAYLDAHVCIRPGLAALQVSQDRLAEKTFLSENRIPVAPYRDIGGLDDLRQALDAIGLPAILKTRRFGYDGKGQVLIRAQDEACEALAQIGNQPAILEGVIDFDCEISVIMACGADGARKSYTPGRNIHQNHILDESHIPAGVTPELEAEAIAIAERIAAALSYTGVLAVEMFVTSGGNGLIVNEIAPRVHNSGHWTLDGAYASQFEQHIRAVAGWPLRDSARHSDVIMKNLIGDDIEEWMALAGDSRCALHLYGKAETRAGRKMGHITKLSGQSE